MRGALTGVRVLEIAGLGPAPFCGMVLSDFGAHVTRIERPGSGGRTRRGGPRITGRGRHSVELDLKSSAGSARFLEYASTADVVIEGMRPGVVERLGIGPAECFERNQRLVYGRVTGWGQDGPLASTAGHDINYLALTGALYHVGGDDGPVPPLNLVGDYGGGGLLLAFGILAALHSARETGQGQVVDAAMIDGVSLMMSYLQGMRGAGEWEDQRQANMLDGAAPFYRTYGCADGHYMAVGAIEPRFYDLFVSGLGLDMSLLPNRDERSNWRALTDVFADRFRSADRAHWESVFKSSDACVTPVLSVPEALAHPHNVSRGSHVADDGYSLPAPAPRLSRTPARVSDLAGVPSA